MQLLTKIVLLGFVFNSCSSDSEIDGEWRVSNIAYEAVYEIKDFSSKKKARILKYDDGTTRFGIKDKEIFLFNNIIRKKDIYIDAISGATKTSTNPSSLEFIHADTLKVTTFIMNKRIQENWIRRKNINHNNN